MTGVPSSQDTEALVLGANKNTTGLYPNIIYTKHAYIFNRRV